MSHQLLKSIPTPSDDDIQHYLNGNLCRCAAYPEIIEAVKRAAKAVGRELRVAFFCTQNNIHIGESEWLRQFEPVPAVEIARGGWIRKAFSELLASHPAKAEKR